METNKGTTTPTPNKASSLLSWLFYALIALLVLVIAYKFYQDKKAQAAAKDDAAAINEAVRDDVGYLDAAEDGTAYNPDGSVENGTESTAITTDRDASTAAPNLKDMSTSSTDEAADPATNAAASSEAVEDDPDDSYSEKSGLVADDASAKEKYMVITGSFKQMLNAQTEQKRLVKKGFGEAEVGKFNRGAYACAIAYRTNDLKEARAVASRLRRDGFPDTIVIPHKSK